ncbi:hypothetical protein [Nonomuraea sp. NPDC049784]|uniref:hypothetical protein n=1 Tax=Nonomuraea sp. NPDC049784 TaxID=3154361 RepID=UPI0033EDD6A1
MTEIDELGINLLTVTPGQTIAGEHAELPGDAPEMIARIGPVEPTRARRRVAASEAGW